MGTSEQIEMVPGCQLLFSQEIFVCCRQNSKVKSRLLGNQSKRWWCNDLRRHYILLSILLTSQVEAKQLFISTIMNSRAAPRELPLALISYLSCDTRWIVVTRCSASLVRVYNICRSWLLRNSLNSPSSLPLMRLQSPAAHRNRRKNYQTQCDVTPLLFQGHSPSFVLTNPHRKKNKNCVFFPPMECDRLNKTKNLSDRKAATACLSFSACSRFDRADVVWLLCCWQPALLEQVDQETNAGRVNTRNWSDRAWERWNKLLHMRTKPYTPTSTESDLAVHPASGNSEADLQSSWQWWGSDRVDVKWRGCCWLPALLEQVNQVE